MSKIDLINDQFKLPIFYNERKMNIKDNILTDLELIKTHDENEKCVYSYIFNDNNIFSKKIMSQIAEYYTDDVVFLKESQELLKTYKNNYNSTNDINCSENEVDDNNIMELWDEIKNDNGFKEKYFYIDWPIWEFLNTSEFFLQFMSIYNMSSPLLSLLTPIIILIVPFFIIKLKGLHLTIHEYTSIIQHILSNHAIGKLGKLFTNFDSISTEQKLFIVTSVAFYFFSIYQNILLCIRFSNNMIKIHNYFNRINKYIERTLSSMNNFLQYSDELKTYTNFNNKLKENIVILNDFKQKIHQYGDFKNIFSSKFFKKISEIGSILQNFYELRYNEIYNNAFLYSFGFNGYILNLERVIENINNKNINFVKFTNKNKKNCFQKSYYGPLINVKHVKNTVKLNKSIVITGPNASGKTTILKSTLINVILSQQFGCGFYKNAVLCPYKYIHCYLNIPDTSGRDSLFQAEVRRCKEIIDIINENKNVNHFCVFDELYSGTNPEEAYISSLIFMEYLVKHKNVSCILTTHFTKVCKKLDNNKNIENLNMGIENHNNSIKYTYTLNSGISEIKGGIQVLYDMNYPKEIMDEAKKHIQN
jgi:energy-coupling factor transporter ATP-binding protein EcfA2